MAAAEEILKLFDKFWYDESVLLTGQKPETNLSLQHHSTALDEVLDAETQEPRPSQSQPTLNVRCHSDNNLRLERGFDGEPTDSFSPNSVLNVAGGRKLQTVPSGKEVDDYSTCKQEDEVVEKAKRPRTRRTRRRHKSFSDLEYEELKGFIDLGFVFSEEDQRDSSLVSIIPGLQRLAKTSGIEEEGKQEDMKERPLVARPYLSEAWSDWEDWKFAERVKMVNWRVSSSVGNETDMKDHLKLWAHTVASAIR